MSFDPNKPFEVVDEFDPNQPFEVLEEQETVLDKLIKAAPIPTSTEDVTSILPEAETVQDFGRGFLQGATMGFSDEMGAATQSVLDKLFGGISGAEEQLVEQGFQFGEGSRMGENVYSTALDEERAKVQEAQERSPVAFGAGEIAGGTVASIPTAGVGTGLKGAQAVKAAAKLGAGTGALSGAGYSEGSITGDTEDQAKLAADVLGGTLFGTVLGGALPIVSQKIPESLSNLGNKLSEFAEDSDYVRIFKQAYGQGKKGVVAAPSSETKAIKKGLTTSYDVAEEGIQDMTSKIIQVDKELSTKVGQAIQEASEQGQLISVSPELADNGQRISEIIDRLNEMSIAPSKYSKTTQPLFEKLQQGQLDPIEARELFKRVEEATSNLYTKKEYGAAEELYQFTKQLRDTLKEQLPQYKQASDSLANFRGKFVDRLLGKGIDPEFTGVRFGNVPDKKAAVRKSLVDTSAQLTVGGGQRNKARATAKALYEYADKYAEPEFTKVFGQADDLLKQIEEVSDAAAVAYRATRNPGLFSGAGSVTGELIKGGVGKGDEFLTRLGNNLGRAASGQGPFGSIVNTAAKSRSIYAQPKEKLYSLADKLDNFNHPHIAKMLREALDSDNVNKKHAALFIIMQKPEARLLFSGEDIGEDDGE